MFITLNQSGLIGWLTLGFGAVLYFQVAQLLLQRHQLAHEQWQAIRSQLLNWVGCAPLLGLLGTVNGLVDQFALGEIQNFGNGISQALLTTKIGLIIAIPAWVILLLAQQTKEER